MSGRCPWCNQEPCEAGNTEDCMELHVFALPPGPFCNRCGHELCPCCPLPWCDTVLVEQDHALCCESECAVAWDDYLEWRAELRAAEADCPSTHSCVRVSEGPWFPADMRRDRGVATWYPPQVFAPAPAVCSLLARVVLWQRERGGLVCDGLIGPSSWCRRDQDLIDAARALAVELRRAGMSRTQLGRFIEANCMGQA
jgi:hypothetical protein